MWEIALQIQTLQYDTFCPEINGMLDKSFWYIHFSKSFVHNILRQREIYCEFTERCPSVLIPTSFQSDGRERDCLRELNPTQLTKTLEFRATIDFNSDLVRTNRIPPTREGLPDERIKPRVRLDALRQQPSILIHGLTQVFTTKEDSNARSPSCRWAPSVWSVACICLEMNGFDIIGSCYLGFDLRIELGISSIDLSIRVTDT